MTFTLDLSSPSHSVVAGSVLSSSGELFVCTLEFVGADEPNSWLLEYSVRSGQTVFGYSESFPTAAVEGLLGTHCGPLLAVLYCGELEERLEQAFSALMNAPQHLPLEARLKLVGPWAGPLVAEENAAGDEEGEQS